MTSTPTTTDEHTVTLDQAALLANHAIFVQGGYSTPTIERERAEKGIAAGEVIDWAKMQAEVDAAMIARYAAGTGAVSVVGSATTKTDANDAVDVTAILTHIDSGAALRTRIAALTADLKIHEDAIKKALGIATEGIDSAGNVVVRLPHRSRHGLDKKLVQAKLSPEDFAACSRVTNYRTLLYGTDQS